MRPKVLMTLALPDPARAVISGVADVVVLGFCPSEEELSVLLGDGVSVLCSQLRDTVSERVLERASAEFKGVCNYAAGFDNIDVEAATRRGLWVTNTPDVVTGPTAELTVAMMLAVARRVVEGDSEVRAGRFTGWAPDYLLGTSLAGKRLGIIGCGRIGLAVARIALTLGMEVVAAESQRRGDAPIERVPLDALLRTSDVVSVHVPLTPETKGMIGPGAIARMKPTAILVNAARGGVVDDAALAHALDDGSIGGAALDVYECEPVVHEALLPMRNVVLLPHLGTATREARAAMADVCARNAVALVRGQAPPDPVNRVGLAGGCGRRVGGQVVSS